MVNPRTRDFRAKPTQSPVATASAHRLASGVSSQGRSSLWLVVSSLVRACLPPQKAARSSPPVSFTMAGLGRVGVGSSVVGTATALLPTSDAPAGCHEPALTKTSTANRRVHARWHLAFIRFGAVAEVDTTRKNPEGALTEVITLSGPSTRLVLQPLGWSTSRVPK